MLVNIIITAAAVISVIYLIRKKINIGIVMILASIYLLLLKGIDLGTYVEAVVTALTSYSTIKLIIVFAFIMMMENVLRSTGMLDRLAGSLKEMVGSNRGAAGLLPIVVGLLPSPGGARFSCPMVEKVAVDRSENHQLAFVNYWFRHVWMDGFMLYPGIILASELLGVSVISFFLKLLPFMILLIIIGYFFGLRNIRKEKIEGKRKIKENLQIFLRSIWPVLGVIFLYMILLEYTGYALEISLVIVVLILFIIKRYDVKNSVRTIIKSFPVKLILIILGVMIFKETLTVSGLLEDISGFIDSADIPIYLVFLLLPFLTGAFSGIAVSFVAMSFPLLLTLGIADNIWYSVFAYISGFIGVMVTPVHLCMVVSSDYFKNPIVKVMKKVILLELPLALLITMAMILLFN